MFPFCNRALLCGREWQKLGEEKRGGRCCLISALVMHKRPVADCFTWADQRSCIHSCGRKERWEVGCVLNTAANFLCLRLTDERVTSSQVRRISVESARLICCTLMHACFLPSLSHRFHKNWHSVCTGAPIWFFSGIIPAMHQLIIFPSCTLLHLLMMGKYGCSLMSYAFQWSACQEPRPCPLNIAHRLGPILPRSRALNWIFSPARELHSSAVSSRVTPPAGVRDSHYWPPSHPVLLKKNHGQNLDYQYIIIWN